MAGVGVLGSNRDLWQFITGSNLLRPKELIGEQIIRNKDRLLKGLTFYKKPVCPAGELLKRHAKLKGVQLECILKVSKFLALDEQQSHGLYLSYLTRDYRGSTKQLQDMLSSTRLTDRLVLQIRDYYYSERLYLLRCLKHLLSFWAESSHPYMEEYASFVSEQYDSKIFVGQIEAQYKAVCEEAAPTWETRGSIMSEKQAGVWLTQNLHEQCELLQILLLYYRSVEHSAESLLDLANLFKAQSFGKRQVNKHLLDDSMEPLLQRIGFLQVLLLIEGLDLEELQEQQSSGRNIFEHHVIGSASFKALDTVFSSLGDHTCHGPLVLTWATVHQMMPDAGRDALVRKLGNRALAQRVFEYLEASLKLQPFSGKSVVASVSQSVVYGLLSVVLDVFEQDTLGSPQALNDLMTLLLKQPVLAEDFLSKGLAEGLGSLLHSASLCFPMDYKPLLRLCTALGGASLPCAAQVCSYLQCLPTFTEFLDRNVEVEPTPDKAVWRLLGDRQPYPGLNNLVIPRGTNGHLITTDHAASVVRWQWQFDAWQVILADIHRLLQQIGRGAGYVSVDNVERVTLTCCLVQAVMARKSAAVVETVPQLWSIMELVFEVIERFSVLASPPLDLLSACLDLATCFVDSRPKQVWHSLRQTGLLPFLTGNFIDMVQATSGPGLNAGAYGNILAGSECPRGRYPVTMSLLHLLASLVQPLRSFDCHNELTGVVLYLTREVFPAFHKWRYYHVNSREAIGQRCLDVFHKVLNIFNNEDTSGKGLGVCEVCVYSLLFTESGQALLAIVSTGVDNIEAMLAAQGSALEGMGVELIHLVRLAFSVLNRLLLLRPTDAPPSPVERSLSLQPANASQQHVVATIAQYIYHRHDTRLPTLATLLLKRLAVVFPMSLLACLGSDAEAIRFMYLMRLQAGTEDVRLKVVILELLAVCVDTQPGLTEIFLNVQLSSKADDKQQELSLGKNSCLQTVLQLIEEKKQGTYQCPADLLCAALQFIQSLWRGQRYTAMAVLRQQPVFWSSVCLSLTRDLQQPSADLQIVSTEVKTVASIFQILAQELYSEQREETLKTLLEELTVKNRLKYWSGYLCQILQCAAQSTAPVTGEVLGENSALHLLVAWRNLLLVTAPSQGGLIHLDGKTKAQLLQDLLTSLQAQFKEEFGPLHLKLASIASALYFTLLKNWISDIEPSGVMLRQLESVLSQSCSSSQTLVPSVQIGLLASLALMLQHHSHSDAISPKDVRLLVPVVCSILQQSTGQLVLPEPTIKNDQNERTTQASGDAQLKLQVTCVNLLEEVMLTLGGPGPAMAMMAQHSIIPCLLTSTQTCIQAQQGIQYVEAAFLLFLTLSKHTESAEGLAVVGFVRHLCLALTLIHRNNNNSDSSDGHHCKRKPGDSAKISKTPEPTWNSIYCLSLAIMSSLLRTLHYGYVEDVLDFVGVHQDRMQQCLNSVGIVMSPSCVLEAEQTCCLLADLACYRHQWQLHLPQALNTLMPCVCYMTNRCISLLIRPQLLQHIFERSREELHILPRDKSLLTPQTRRLSQQTSTDDSESISTDVVNTQHRLLSVVAHCLVTLKHFSPDLCQILLDQSLDLTEYQPVLALGFGIPSVEHDSLPTFGTCIACVGMCLRWLMKMYPKGSPQKGQPPDLDSFPIKRALLMFVLENTLHLIMTQALRYLKEPQLSGREKQQLKQELRDELKSFLDWVAAAGPLASPQTHSKPQGQESQHYLKLVHQLIEKVFQ